MNGRKTLALALNVVLILLTNTLRSSVALEPGQGPQTKPGIAIGISAAPLPPGFYTVNHAFYYDFRLSGPGVITAPNAPRGHASEVDPGFLWVPDWTFFGARYSAYLAFPFVATAIDSAAAGFPGISFEGMHNTFISPLRLQWNVGNGFFVQSGFGVYFPDGSISGPLGNSNTGADYFTFQPHFVLSYVKEGWNLTSYMYYEHNTKNVKSGYTSGDIFHADLTATKQFGKWTVGPVAYYVAQMTSDKPGAATDSALSAALPSVGGINGFTAGKFEAFAVGGLVGYDFGGAFLTVFATNEIFARAFEGNSGTPSLSSIPFTNETTTRGWTLFSRLTYQLWGPQPPPTRRSSMNYK
jgi:hypothetical protein